VIGSHVYDSIYCSSCIVIGSDYLVPVVCVEMAEDPLVPPSPTTHSDSGVIPCVGNPLDDKFSAVQCSISHGARQAGVRRLTK
jgi:hypothetical protein